MFTPRPSVDGRKFLSVSIKIISIRLVIRLSLSLKKTSNEQRLSENVLKVKMEAADLGEKLSKDTSD